MHIKDHVFIVTGASSGIGLSTAIGKVHISLDKNGVNRSVHSQKAVARGLNRDFERCAASSSENKGLSGSIPSALRHHLAPRESIASLSASSEYGCAPLLPGSAAGLHLGGALRVSARTGKRFATQGRQRKSPRVRSRFPIRGYSLASNAASMHPSFRAE